MQHFKCFLDKNLMCWINFLCFQEKNCLEITKHV